MQSRPRDASPLRTLTAAKESLAAAKRAKEEAEKRIADSETEVAAAQRAVEAAKYSALIAVKPRALWKAYALWLFTPLLWPGAYLFYLGRDTHAWLHTVTFGGFGIGWLLDFFYIPLYVADQNEPDGYLEGVERRMSRYFSLDFLLLMPLRLLLILIVGTYFGLIFAYVLPKPLPIDGLTLSTSAAISYCVGMLAIALAVKLCACPSATRARRAHGAPCWLGTSPCAPSSRRGSAIWQTATPAQSSAQTSTSHATSIRSLRTWPGRSA